MKNLQSFMTEGFELMTSPIDSLAQWDNAYAASRGIKKFIGGIGGFKNTPNAMDISIFFPTGDEAYVKSSMAKKLKSGEYLFRYTNARLKAAGMVPIVKVNLKRGMVYWNKPEASEMDILDFEARGEKVRFINLRDDWKSYMKGWMHG